MISGSSSASRVSISIVAPRLRRSRSTMPVDQRIEIDRLRVERLAPPEGEQPLGELGAELGGLLRLLENLAILRVLEPPLEHLEIAGDHREKIVEVMGDAAGELADGLHLLRLAQLLLHLDPRREVADEAGEDGGPAELHLADRELHREDRAVLALRLHLAADADDALLAGPPVSREIAVMVLAMGRGHEHLDVAPDHLAGGVAEQLFRRGAEGLDDAALVDRDDRVGRGFEDGAQPRLALLDHRLGMLRLGHVQIEISRIDDGISPAVPMQRPLARDDQSTAIPMGMLQLALPFSPLQQLGLDLRPAAPETPCARSSWEIRPMASSADQP